MGKTGELVVLHKMIMVFFLLESRTKNMDLRGYGLEDRLTAGIGVKLIETLFWNLKFLLPM
jgi:hypothetical protein